ncbi:nicotinate-nucleotide adenylyltransferase [Luteimonas sp. RD2P54]|uniref:Probable nicotinate-nucleotide adenylyltransferase n=1 Tax=Luteimonas endophytica TaxID=3042023 RepID=A0ABT6J985_9GAMM|nr:nicotinate-nucleotide adenylyltransferase [Luteimonas endophytica]MDH5823377.1 nicotinate-nucleotide adenylyltransferase [Luteimonas endophytica]
MTDPGGSAPAPDLLLFYGGTFDPVHNGHLAIARAARDRLHCPVRLMPAGDPPHRPPPGASAEHRAAMLRLALAEERELCMDRRELERGGRSYTVETLRALRRGRPCASVALLLGADSFAGLMSWKDWRDLFSLAHLVIAERAGSPLGDLAAPLAAELEARGGADAAALRRVPAGRILRLQQPLSGESATRLRALIAAGGDWRRLLPAAVAGYIDHHGLYRDGGGDGGAGAAPL